MTININYLLIQNVYRCHYIYYLQPEVQQISYRCLPLITWSVLGIWRKRWISAWRSVFSLLYSWNRNHLYDIIYMPIYKREAWKLYIKCLSKLWSKWFKMKQCRFQHQSYKSLWSSLILRACNNYVIGFWIHNV